MMNAFAHRLTLEQEGRALVERLGGRWTGSGGLCRCPAHQDRTPSLSIRAGRSRLLLHCFAGCDTSDILRALLDSGLLRPGPAGQGPGLSPASRSSAPAGVRRLWAEAREIQGTPAERYLAWRGIRGSSSQLRYHPRTPLGPKPLTRFRPALLAAVRDETGLVAVHRTFLGARTARLAPLDHPKCALGALGGGAVRLGGVAPVLGLAEGLETALSATLLFGSPCWATLGAERFARVRLAAGVKRLRLFLDNDAGGRRAEALARDAFGDRCAVEADYPPQPGEDWNDVLRALAGAGC